MARLAAGPKRPALLAFIFHVLFEDEATTDRHEVDPQRRVTVRVFEQFVAYFVQLIIACTDGAAAVQAAVTLAGLRRIGAADVVCRGVLGAPALAQLFVEPVCLLHPSYVGNSPNSVCEAQTAGLPVVASDVGGVRSLVEEEVTGLLRTLAPASIAARASPAPTR